MVPFEVSIAILNYIADPSLVLPSNRGRWQPFEKTPNGPPRSAFLKGYREDG